MRVREVIWLPEIEDKLWDKHRITVLEAEEVLFGEPHIRFVEQGHQEGEDLYAALWADRRWTLRDRILCLEARQSSPRDQCSRHGGQGAKDLWPKIE